MCPSIRRPVSLQLPSLEAFPQRLSCRLLVYFALFCIGNDGRPVERACQSVHDQCRCVAWPTYENQRTNDTGEGGLMLGQARPRLAGCRESVCVGIFLLTLLTGPNIVHAAVQNTQALLALCLPLCLIPWSCCYFFLLFVSYFSTSLTIARPDTRETTSTQWPRTSSFPLSSFVSRIATYKKNGCRGRALSLVVQCGDAIHRRTTIVCSTLQTSNATATTRRCATCKGHEESASVCKTLWETTQ